MMDHIVVSIEQVEWLYTSSDDDQARCMPEVRREKEITIKYAWLDSILLDIVVQE